MVFEQLVMLFLENLNVWFHQAQQMLLDVRILTCAQQENMEQFLQQVCVFPAQLVFTV